MEGSYEPSLETGRRISSPIPLVRIQSHDHTQLQGRLGHVV